jgi:ribosomal protein L3 glutamine methyltransferase
LPLAYITGRAYFAGLRFKVNEHVLVPRSPFAELIEMAFSPWVDNPNQVRRVLDLGTGSGCIGIACAYALPYAKVDLLDISPQALEVAKQNIQYHGLENRVQAFESDVFSALGDERYDIIVSNPPYVCHAEMDTLPAEYQHEPSLGLEAGEDGMDIVSRILQGAKKHLNPGGILVVEVGASAGLLQARYPDEPFVWLDLERGGEGIFLMTAEQLQR